MAGQCSVTRKNSSSMLLGQMAIRTNIACQYPTLNATKGTVLVIRTGNRCFSGTASV